MRIHMRIAAVVFLFLLPATALAQNSITPGQIILQSTFESISVKASFSGDVNGNSGAVIQYRESGAVAWLNAYTPLIDRRATIGGAANPYANQARVSIVGLTADTNYEVQVLWTDADGVSTQPLLGVVSTLSYTLPAGGLTIAVNPVTLAAAISGAIPGLTIHLSPGTYPPFTVDRSGTAAAFITIEGEPGALVTGVGAAQNIRVSADYVVVKNLTLGPSDSSGIVVSGGRHHVFIQDNTIQNVSAQCAANPSGHYGDAGISVGGGSNNIFALRNTVISTSLANPLCLRSPIYDSPGAGIQWGSGHTLVIADNTVTGAFRDSVTADSDVVTENVDILRNTVNGDYRDDGVESKGANVNVRVAGNTIEATGPGGFTCIAGNSNDAKILYGPFYIFRNSCRVTNTFSLAGTVFKIGGARTYVFHNSMDASGAVQPWDGVAFTGAGGRPDLEYQNNILKLKGNSIASWGTGAVLDYNVYRNTDPGRNFVRSWNGSTSYLSIATFGAGTGQEAHGKQADPLFDAQLNIGSGSPAVDSGTLIPNFNGPTSAWPFSGTAPDAGRYESGGVVVPPPPPPPPPPPVDLPPIPGGSGLISISSIRSTTLTLAWALATDDKPGLLYEVRRSLADNMDTVALAEANGTVIKPYTSNLASLNATGLTVANVYRFVVIVKDSKGQKSIYKTVRAKYEWHAL